MSLVNRKFAPKVSVIVAEANIVVEGSQKENVERTIRSVFSQTYKNIECLVVEAGAIRILSTPVSSVQISADNASGIWTLLDQAIEHTSGDYICILRKGSCFHDVSILEKLTSGVEEADIIYGNLGRVFPNNVRDEVSLPESSLIEQLTHNTFPLLATSLVRKELLQHYKLHREEIRFVNEWVFLVSTIILAKSSVRYIDVVVADVLVNRAGWVDKISNGHLAYKERTWAVEHIFPTLAPMYRIPSVQAPSVIKKLAFDTLETVKRQWRSYRSERDLARYRQQHAEACYNIPIIINNRNHVSYLKRLIASLEKRGYKNIYIIDNNSDYPPLIAYYEETPYHVFKLNQNVGFCALWDTSIFDFFKDQYYVYTDSDLEIVGECPRDFMIVLHYLISRYSLGKVGLSLAIDDLPEYFVNRAEVIAWEQQFQINKVEKLAYAAHVDSTFALYRPNSFGYAGMISSFRTSYPYSAQHLPWYENTLNLTEEQRYYYQNAKTSSHWSEKIKV